MASARLALTEDAATALEAIIEVTSFASQQFQLSPVSLGSWPSTNDMINCLALADLVEPQFQVCRSQYHPKWPGGPCRPAGEKTPPTATLLIKTLLVHLS